MAQMFIDQLEMLEAKTKNNLSKQEASLLRQSLTSVRLAFVETVNEQGDEPQRRRDTESTEVRRQPAESAEAATAAEPEDTRKKFTKKY
jgi:hypothetical protein